MHLGPTFLYYFFFDCAIFYFMNYIEQEMPKAGDTVIVGMSGGIDSTLTALLLLERGCKVIGATMSLWDGKLPEGVNIEELPPSCYSPAELKNIEECRAFCEQHGMEYYVVDVKQEYQDFVLSYFKNEYRSGRTPNPCIQCNATVKFGAFLKGLEKLNVPFDYFCTGHYAKIVRPESSLFGTDSKPCMISGATDVTKDQTYFLYRIPSTILEKVRFPLANITKKEVFELAEKANLAAAKRKESQDFVGEEFFDMIFSDKPSVPGDIVDLDGKVLGKHKGIEHYTIGQRRGLGVAVSYPVYVQAIDAKKNIVVLAPNDALNAPFLIADNFVWPGNVEPSEPVESMVKIRLASRPVKAIIEKYVPKEDEIQDFCGTSWKVTFEEQQRAIAPGQSVVMYKDGVIIGGGIIAKVGK